MQKEIASPANIQDVLRISNPAETKHVSRIVHESSSELLGHLKLQSGDTKLSKAVATQSSTRILTQKACREFRADSANLNF